MPCRWLQIWSWYKQSQVINIHLKERIYLYQNRIQLKLFRIHIPRMTFKEWRYLTLMLRGGRKDDTQQMMMCPISLLLATVRVALICCQWRHLNARPISSWTRMFAARIFRDRTAFSCYRGVPAPVFKYSYHSHMHDRHFRQRPS